MHRGGQLVAHRHIKLHVVVASLPAAGPTFVYQSAIAMHDILPEVTQEYSMISDPQSSTLRHFFDLPFTTYPAAGLSASTSVNEGVCIADQRSTVGPDLLRYMAQALVQTRLRADHLDIVRQRAHFKSNQKDVLLECQACLGSQQ